MISTPLPGANQNGIRNDSLSGCDCGGRCWGLLTVCNTSVCGDMSPVDYLTGSEEIDRNAYFRETYTNGESDQPILSFYIIIHCRGRMAVRRMAGRLSRVQRAC